MQLKRDIRQSDLYLESKALFTALRQPGTGRISDAAEIHVSPSGQEAVFAGAIMSTLEGTPPTRICLTQLDTGDIRVLTFGPNTDRLPKFSPNARQIAFLSDRHEAGNFQLYLLDPRSGAARRTPLVDGWVEYLHWSPDGTRILLGVAGHGADVAGVQGAVTSKAVGQDAPSWLPAVGTAGESYCWRRAWVYELATDSVRAVSQSGVNVWEAVWCGIDSLAAVVSPRPGEGHWYSATLALMEIHTGRCLEVFKPRDQLGWPAGCSSGKYLAFVEAICSDRGVVAGSLHLIETASGKIKEVDTRGVDVTHTEWRSDRLLLLAGHRGLETVVGFFDTLSNSFTQTWSSRDITTGGRYAAVSGINESADCVLLGESYLRAPEIGVIRQGDYSPVKSLDPGYGAFAAAISAVKQVQWKAPDGLDIQGWLLRPAGTDPHPLVMVVHGGPVSHSRQTWLGRSGFILMLIKRGFAIFYPNPRGSSGRGRDFARAVYGDMGGADAQDLLSGLDALVERGIADPRRLGVTGVSYGGFMTSWLITQDARFAAAVPVAPHNNQVTCRLIGNLPHFMDLVLEDKFNNPGGRYFDRSPIMHAHKVKTPTLHVCGALDRCTPPEEAVQFHNALLENDIESVLLTYPEEGHGVRKFPAVIDYAARVVAWFETHVSDQDKHLEA
jgi:dipeptidyl aminopeptidase/acylaminoacyl peptidase